jgi:hypothetical protein
VDTSSKDCTALQYLPPLRVATVTTQTQPEDPGPTGGLTTVPNSLDPNGSIISKAEVDVDVDIQFMAISAVGAIMSVVATWAILD